MLLQPSRKGRRHKWDKMAQFHNILFFLMFYIVYYELKNMSGKLGLHNILERNNGLGVSF